MKKIFKIISSILAIAILFITTGCGADIQKPSVHEQSSVATKSFNPKYIDYLVPNYNVPDNNYNLPSGISPSSEKNHEFKKIFDEICRFYHIEKELPSFEFLNENQFEEYAGNNLLKACYSFIDKKVYLSINIDLNKIVDKETFVHEILHYLSDNGEKRGFIYFREDKEFNRLFNEGATEFLASKFLGTNVDGPYEFQETLVKQISVCIGEKKIQDAYFNSDDSEIRKIFNEAVVDVYTSTEFDNISYDPFDTFAGTCYTAWSLGMYGNFEGECLIFTALEEEILYFSKVSKKLDDSKKVLSEFFKSFKAEEEILEVLFDAKYLKSFK